MFDNKIKRKLYNNEVVIGSFLTMNAPDIVEIMGLCGYDFVVIDCEHGSMTEESMPHIIRAAEAKEITPIVRIFDHTPRTILHALDIGAYGIQVPQIETFDETVQIVKSAKYFPLGNRGGALARSADYGIIPSVEYFSLANEHTMIVIQCETKQALDNLEHIAQVPNLDVIFLGPFDMSISLGVPSEINHPKVIEAEEKVLEISRNYEKIPGIYVRNAEQAMQKIDKGFRYIVMGTDNRLIINAYKEMISPLKFF